MIGISGAGLLSVFLMKEVALHDVIDAKYALKEVKMEGDGANAKV